MTKPIPDPKDHIVLHMAAPNDTMGRPRRVYVVVRTSGRYPSTVGTYDEGYAGLDALAPMWGDVYNPRAKEAWAARVVHPRLPCTLTDYRAWRRLHAQIVAEQAEQADSGLHVGQGPR